MFIKKKEKQRKDPEERIKTRTIKIGIRKNTTIFFWILLIGSVVFGIYKNFTAVNTHTITETKVIEKSIIDTNRIETFVKNFAQEYFTWDNKKEGFVSIRREALQQYLTEELYALNLDTIRSDIPTSAAVKSIDIWNVVQHDDTNYEVLFSVNQLITEKNEKNLIHSAYTTVVHVDKQMNLVITKNPTINKIPVKSSYEPEKTKDNNVDTDMSLEVLDFLKTFFQRYPNATVKELSYYMKQLVLTPIDKDYIFVDIINPFYRKEGKQIIADITVKFIDQETKAIQLSQYNLTLEKHDNWMIIK